MASGRADGLVKAKVTHYYQLQLQTWVALPIADNTKSQIFYIKLFLVPISFAVFTLASYAAANRNFFV